MAQSPLYKHFDYVYVTNQQMEEPKLKQDTDGGAIIMNVCKNNSETYLFLGDISIHLYQVKDIGEIRDGDVTYRAVKCLDEDASLTYIFILENDDILIVNEDNDIAVFLTNDLINKKRNRHNYYNSY